MSTTVSTSVSTQTPTTATPTAAPIEIPERCPDAVAVAVHDLQTPLMIVGASARALCSERARGMIEEEKEEHLDRLLRNVEALEHRAAALSRAARLQMRGEAGEEQARLARLNLTRLARETACDFEAAEAGEAGVGHPVCFEGEGVCWVLGDREQLRGVLLNLLSNAAKYSAPGRRITVSVWCHQGEAHLSVEDRGVGIEPVENERLFEPFHRLDCTRHMAPGDGLGLASVSRVVQAHGGEVVVSGVPNQGTVVDVRLRMCGCNASGIC